jgi:hypothetical protein
VQQADLESGIPWRIPTEGANTIHRGSCNLSGKWTAGAAQRLMIDGLMTDQAAVFRITSFIWKSV